MLLCLISFRCAKVLKYKQKTSTFPYFLNKKGVDCSTPFIIDTKPTIHILFLQTLQQTQRDDF